MEPGILALIVLGSIALGILSLLMIYWIAVTRRANVVMKKVDYLVEDLTYKSEALSVGVEAVQKVSDYVLAADSFSKKGFKSLLKLFTQNKNFFYELIDKIKEDPNNKKTVDVKATEEDVKKEENKDSNEDKKENNTFEQNGNVK